MAAGAETEKEAEALEGTPLLLPKLNDVHVSTSAAAAAAAGSSRWRVCGRCAGAAVSLPLALFRRKKSDEVSPDRPPSQPAG